MATVNANHRLLAGRLYANLAAAGEEIWCLEMDTREEELYAEMSLDLTLHEVVGGNKKVVYFSKSLREVETFKKQWFTQT